MVTESRIAGRETTEGTPANQDGDDGIWDQHDGRAGSIKQLASGYILKEERKDLLTSSTRTIKTRTSLRL